MTVTAGSGLYRGVCVDNQDPDGLGRIRVQVPQLLGSAASGWAFPAWSFHDLTIWPQDRLPNPGDGVWVMFESTSPDKMIWIAAFGPVDLINQPGFVEKALYDVTLTLVVPPLEWNQPAVFTGVLGSVGGGIPNPNPVVELHAQPLGGEWQKVALTENINAIDGSWSISYAPTIPGSVAYKAVFPGNTERGGVYGAAESSQDATNTATATATSDPSLPTLHHGSGFTVSGTVTAVTGERVTSGEAQLWSRKTVGADTSWSQQVAQPVVDGTYTLTSPPLSHLGPTEWQVRYTSPDRFEASVSATISQAVGLRPGPTISGANVSHSSAAFYWSPVSGAESYDLQRRVDGGVWTLLASDFTGTTASNGGLAENTVYEYQVRPRGPDPAGTEVYGAWSPAIRMTTGRPEIRDTGTSGDIDVTTMKFRSWRDSDADQPKGWQAWMRQGRPNDGRSANYLGLAIFGNNTVRDKIRAALGGGDTGIARQVNGTCSSAGLELYKRDNNEQSNRVTINFRTSDSVGGDVGTQQNGPPSPQGSMVSRTSSVKDAIKWYDIGTAHGQRLGDNTARSVYISNGGGPSQYASFSGTAHLRLRWTWDYASQTLIAPKWY